MNVGISWRRFEQFLGVLLAALMGVLALDAQLRDPVKYHNDQSHYGFTIPRGWELIGDDLLDAMNKNNQAAGLPRLVAVVRSPNLTSGLPIWIEVHKAEPLDIGGFEGYVHDIESAVGLSAQEMAEQIDNPELKKLARASARHRLVKVDRDSWRVVLENEQPDLGVKSAVTTCFGNNISVKIAYHASASNFSNYYAAFESLTNSLRFDAGHVYNPKDYSTLARSLVSSSLKILSKFTTPVALVLVFLVLVLWRSVKRRKVLGVSLEEDSKR